MIQDKYKVRLHLHEYKFYLKIVALNKKHQNKKPNYNHS